MKNTKGAVKKLTHHVMAFHHGRALFSLAQAYPSLMTVIPEAVQNGIDSDVEAKKIEIVVDFKRQTAVIRDNGHGTTVRKFGDALGSVATPHRKGMDALGRFGIGLISPLGKCASFEFTSRPTRGPENKRVYTKWTFNCQQILNSKQSPDIPVEQVVSAEKNPWWSSEMKLIGLVKDRTIAHVDIDELIRKITSTLGIRMRRLGTVLSLKIITADGEEIIREDVKAPEFRGTPIPVHEIKTDTGKVVFRLFKATPAKKKNDVLVGVLGDEFRFPIKHLRIVNIVPEKILNHINSGLFEGEILAEGLTLRPERQAFVQDEAYLDFGVAIEEWFEKIGVHLVAEARDNTQAVRWQELGLRALGVCKQLLELPQFTELKEVLSRITTGSVGIMHASTQISGGADKKVGFSIDGGVGRERAEKKPAEQQRTDPDDRTPREGHSPMVVEGPLGNPRSPVRKHSTGITLSHEPLEGSSDLYRFDLKTGTLTFNIRHPAWVLADESGSGQSLMRFQEMIIIQALTCEALPATHRDAYRMGIEAAAGPMGAWMVAADGIRRKSSSLELEI
jgi:hypothetical protein